MIEILETFSLNCVHDLGRAGVRQYGLGRGGVMDRLALCIGNLMLGNDAGLAGIEVQLFPFRLRFEKNTTFAITGSQNDATLNGDRLPPWWVTNAKAGDVLTLPPPAKGARSYLTFDGGLDTPVVMGSRSTILQIGIGGFEGRSLRTGDRLPLGPSTGCRLRDATGFGIRAPERSLAAPTSRRFDAKNVVVRVIPSAEYDEFDPESRQRFWEETWKITPQSNRMGYRLEGRALKRMETSEMRSHGIVAGVLQVPPSGQPIVQLADAASAGGYPKIGVVIEADLWRLAQARPGQSLYFEQATTEQARAAEREQAAYLETLKHQVSYRHETK